VKILEPATVDEMVAAVLKAEIEASRYKQVLRDLMRGLDIRRIVVDQPDTTSRVQNEQRARILRCWRGWDANGALFQGWPDGVEWSWALLEPSDEPHLRYAYAPEWRELSGETCIVAEGASQIGRDDSELLSWWGHHGTLDAINGIRNAVEAGKTFAPIVATGPEEGDVIVLVEGHARMTAYLSLGFSQPLKMIYGPASLERLRSWVYLPRDLR
jgi:hypothetical protein